MIYHNMIQTHASSRIWRMEVPFLRIFLLLLHTWRLHADNRTEPRLFCPCVHLTHQLLALDSLELPSWEFSPLVWPVQGDVLAGISSAAVLKSDWSDWIWVFPVWETRRSILNYQNCRCYFVQRGGVKEGGWWGTYHQLLCKQTLIIETLPELRSRMRRPTVLIFPTCQHALQFPHAIAPTGSLWNHTGVTDIQQSGAWKPRRFHTWHDIINILNFFWRYFLNWSTVSIYGTKRLLYTSTDQWDHRYVLRTYR